MCGLHAIARRIQPYLLLLLLLLPFTRQSLRIEHYWQGSDRIHCVCWLLYVTTIL
jgi:hypothetical protein